MVDSGGLCAGLRLDRLLAMASPSGPHAHGVQSAIWWQCIVDRISDRGGVGGAGRAACRAGRSWIGCDADAGGRSAGWIAASREP
eukprot:7377301-Prymnesium_polylepis.1